jgi:hypothetical protein
VYNLGKSPDTLIATHTGSALVEHRTPPLPVAALSPERLDALRKLQDYERRVAMLNSELAEEIFDPVEERIQKELFARDVK